VSCRRLTWLAGCLVLAVACGCAPRKTAERNSEVYVADTNSVGFNIEPLPAGGGSARWLATYSSNGKTARFEIELTSSTPLEDEESKRFNIKSGKGKLVAVPLSDASVLLLDLKKALEAKTVPGKVQRADSVSFEFVSFGQHLSQASGGGFAEQPVGNWTPMKIFLGEGANEGQVFLNLNPVIKMGSFSIKDPEYGDLVLAQLAKVL